MPEKSMEFDPDQAIRGSRGQTWVEHSRRWPAIAFGFVVRRGWWAFSLTRIGANSGRQGHRPTDRRPAHDLGSPHVASAHEGIATRHARGGFRARLSAGGVLIEIGALTYTFGNGWKLVDGFYFAVATLTTSSIADSNLVLRDSWMKVFTVFYILIGIGILVEIVRRLGFAFVEVRREEKAATEMKTAPPPGT